MNWKLLEVAFLLDNGLNFGERFQLAGGIDQMVKALAFSGERMNFSGNDFITEGLGRNLFVFLLSFGTRDEQKSKKNQSNGRKNSHWLRITKWRK